MRKTQITKGGIQSCKTCFVFFPTGISTNEIIRCLPPINLINECWNRNLPEELKLNQLLLLLFFQMTVENVRYDFCSFLSLDYIFLNSMLQHHSRLHGFPHPRYSGRDKKKSRFAWSNPPFFYSKFFQFPLILKGNWINWE